MIPPDQNQVDQAWQLRQETIKRRLWQLIGIAAGLSLLIHFGIMFYLGQVKRSGPPAQVVEMVMEFPTTRTVEELTTLSETDLAEPDVESRSELDRILEPDIPSPEESAAAELSESNVGATPTLGGSGQKGVSGQAALGGAGGAASFFGVSSKGERFAYIVDRSGSMAINDKLILATTELKRSVKRLPDYAQFFVVFFSSRMTPLPSWQQGWVRARPHQFNRLVGWIRKINDEGGNGGTQPLSSFRRVLSLTPKPDVIFFLTDGQVQGMTAADVANLNRKGEPSVINTIAYATNESQQLLERIAHESGGVYRFVPVRSTQ
ncbi:MAG: hypothetical protein P8M22_03655 [Phycisphaerales bacterium]|nr:hypothetical protein [Phycisphaerales bacterium]